MIPCQGPRAETRVRQLLFISAGVISMKGGNVWSCSGGPLCPRARRRLSQADTNQSFSLVDFFQLSRRALGHKGPPTQLHALPPFIEITPALMNNNLLSHVSAHESWQGIVHLVRSLACFHSSQPNISLNSFDCL